EQHRDDGGRAQRGLAAALQPHDLRTSPAQHRDRRRAGVERGGGGAGAGAAGERQGEGGRPQARGSALELPEDAAHLGQRRRRRVVEGADGEILLSVERAQHPFPPLGRRGRARAFDRAQGRGGGIKGVRGGGGGVLLESGGGDGGETHVQRRARRCGIQVDAAGG